MAATERIWQAIQAGDKLPEVIDGALSGVLQVIRNASGEEVVVLSRRQYEAMRPTLKEFLLQGGPMDDDDRFDALLRTVRHEGPSLFGENRPDPRD